MRRETGLFKFVRALSGGATATRKGDVFAAATGPRIAASAVLPLIESGTLSGDRDSCCANAETRSWLKRQMLDDDAFATQHRLLVPQADDTILNLNESPLARLALKGAGEAEPFLARHHVEAGERVRHLVARAQLQPRMTMNYTPSLTASMSQGHLADIPDMAVDARKALAEIHTLLPRDCAGVVVDVCGLLKGLQVVEAERGWPRRSAKLVLRIGLDRLAEHFGYAPAAVGAESNRPHRWMGEAARPDRFE